MNFLKLFTTEVQGILKGAWLHSKNHVADFTSTKTSTLRSKNMSLILRQPKRTPHAVGSCPWTDWRPFEIWVSITWNTPNFDHTYLATPNVKSIGSFAKTKESFLFYLIFDNFDHRRP
jgi:hypothetical protein